jgi:hypothetical protein
MPLLFIYWHCQYLTLVTNDRKRSEKLMRKNSEFSGGGLVSILYWNFIVVTEGDH